MMAIWCTMKATCASKASAKGPDTVQKGRLRSASRRVQACAAAAALMLTDRMRLTIALSVLFGVVSAAVGYYVSWVEQLPTGATMVVVASLFLLPGLVKILRRSSV